MMARKILELRCLRHGQKLYLKWILTEGKSEAMYLKLCLVDNVKDISIT